MTQVRQSFETDVATLLTLLEGVLLPSQLWELELHIEHEEYEFTFELLGEMLRDAAAKLPENALELYANLASDLALDEALWRDLCRKKT